MDIIYMLVIGVGIVGGLGYLAGYFFASWLVITLAIILTALEVFGIKDLFWPKHRNTNSGQVGASSLALGILILVAVFLIIMLLTHYFVTDTTFIGDVYKNIKILR